MTSCIEILKWCVSLRRMLVCCRELYVYQGFPVISMMDREHLSQLFCYWGTRWWNILKLNYEQQRCHSSTTSDWWTIYICEFSVTGWTPSSRHLYCWRSEMLLLHLLLMEHFSSSVHHLLRLQPGQRTLIISSLVRRRLPHPDYNWNSESWLTTFRVNSEKLCNIVNYDSQLVIILLFLWQPIMICDYPSIPQNVTTFYPLQRTDVFFYNRYLPHGYILPLHYPTEIVTNNVRLPNH